MGSSFCSRANPDVTVTQAVFLCDWILGFVRVRRCLGGVKLDLRVFRRIRTSSGQRFNVFRWRCISWPTDPYRPTNYPSLFGITCTLDRSKDAVGTICSLKPRSRLDICTSVQCNYDIDISPQEGIKWNIIRHPAVLKLACIRSRNTINLISGSVFRDSGHVEGSEGPRPRRKFGIDAG